MACVGLLVNSVVEPGEGEASIVTTSRLTSTVLEVYHNRRVYKTRLVTTQAFFLRFLLLIMSMHEFGRADSDSLSRFIKGLEGRNTPPAP